MPVSSVCIDIQNAGLCTRVKLESKVYVFFLQNCNLEHTKQVYQHIQSSSLNVEVVYQYSLLFPDVVTVCIEILVIALY